MSSQTGIVPSNLISKRQRNRYCSYCMPLDYDETYKRSRVVIRLLRGKNSEAKNEIARNV